MLSQVTHHAFVSATLARVNRLCRRLGPCTRRSVCSRLGLIILMVMGVISLVVGTVLPESQHTVGLGGALSAVGGVMLGVSVSTPLAMQWENIWRPILVGLAFPVAASIGACTSSSSSSGWIFALVVALVGSFVGVFVGRLCMPTQRPPNIYSVLTADDELEARYYE